MCSGYKEPTPLREVQCQVEEVQSIKLARLWATDKCRETAAVSVCEPLRIANHYVYPEGTWHSRYKHAAVVYMRTWRHIQARTHDSRQERPESPTLHCSAAFLSTRSRSGGATSTPSTTLQLGRYARGVF